MQIPKTLFLFSKSFHHFRSDVLDDLELILSCGWYTAVVSVYLFGWRRLCSRESLRRRAQPCENPGNDSIGIVDIVERGGGASERLIWN